MSIRGSYGIKKNNCSIPIIQGRNRGIRFHTKNTHTLNSFEIHAKTNTTVNLTNRANQIMSKRQRSKEQKMRSWTSFFLYKIFYTVAPLSNTRCGFVDRVSNCSMVKDKVFVTLRVAPTIYMTQRNWRTLLLEGQSKQMLKASINITRNVQQRNA